MIKSSIRLFLFLSVFCNTVKAQTFWTETFTSNCASACKANGFPGVKGNWTVVTPTTSTEGADANDWFVSYSEEGKFNGQCQNTNPVKNSCLHVSIKTDIGGAIFTKGPTGKTDKRAISPTIDCSGKTNVKLRFDFVATTDSTLTPLNGCDLEYSSDDGVNWTTLRTLMRAYQCSSTAAMWRLYENVLPASANNNPKVKIAFHWKSESTGGNDQSFAVDSIVLSTASSTLTTGVIPGAPFCPCSAIKVPYDGRGITFSSLNTFTAQLSDATGSFATPTVIGTLPSTSADTGRVNAIIPCNLPPGTGYKIRVISSTPPLIGTEVGIVISSPIKITVTPNPAAVCLGQKVVLKPTGGDPGKYEWWNGTIPPNVPVISADSLTVTPAKDTSLVVIGRKGSCFDNDTIKIKVDVPPIVKVTNDTTCIGLPAMLIATGGGTYLWNTGSTKDTLIVPNQTKDTVYSVTVTKGACKVTASGSVKVYPTIAVGVNSPTICGGVPTKLTATGAISYVWSTTEKTPSITVSPLVTTTYTVTGTAGSCKGVATATVTVIPKPDVKIATPKSVCQGSSVTITASGADKYFWLIPTNDTTATITVKPAFSTTYTVVGTKNGCVDTATVLVTIDQRPNVTVTNPIICQGGTAIITATGATTYLWPASGDTTATVYIKGLMTDATIKVYGFNGACSDTAFAFVTVGVPVPVVVTGKNEIYSCESTQLFAEPTDGTYSWGVVGGAQETIECPTCPSTIVTPPNTQAYYVVYTSPKNCIGRDTILVTVINTNSYFIPTGFSPNGDGINDLVQVHGRGIENVSLMIFDRIGEKVFETHELESGWDGRLHGAIMNDGVFVYKLEITYCNGEKLKETGNVTLLK